MKIKLRFGDPKYWYKKEKWQYKAKRNLNALIIISTTGVIWAIQLENVIGAITFGTIMALYTIPQRYQYSKWFKQHLRKEAGIE